LNGLPCRPGHYWLVSSTTAEGIFAIACASTGKEYPNPYLSLIPEEAVKALEITEDDNEIDA
jgi:hypothetical protein